MKTFRWTIPEPAHDQALLDVRNRGQESGGLSAMRWGIGIRSTPIRSSDSRA